MAPASSAAAARMLPSVAASAGAALLLLANRAEGAARCADIVTSRDVFGEPAAGASLRCYTSFWGASLHWLGCHQGVGTCGPSDFFCDDAGDKISFGLNPNATDSLSLFLNGRIPEEPVACAPHPQSSNAVAALGHDADAGHLCRQMGYESGRIERRSAPGGGCSEAHWTGHLWAQAEAPKQGAAAVITCEKRITDYLGSCMCAAGDEAHPECVQRPGWSSFLFSRATWDFVLWRLLVTVVGNGLCALIIYVLWRTTNQKGREERRAFVREESPEARAGAVPLRQ